jgi:NAD(P)-dependent dehydrogenase (short-subunit alcohol dehydrogenase family)
MTLSNKIALVAGGTGALGSVIAARLSAEGCVVYASSHHEKEGTSGDAASSNNVKILNADFTDEIQVKDLFDKIIRDSSRIDIVVNTVGGFVPGKPLRDVTLSDWDLMMNINLKSAFLAAREAIRRMEGQSFGRIINISAMAGLNPGPGRAPYTISKAGVSLLTEIVSKEVKGTGITVNAIAPSIIVTAANLKSMPDEDSTKWVTPDQLADLVCYLCSPSAAAITGTTLKAYGGV